MSFGLLVPPTKWLWDFCESRVGGIATIVLLAIVCVALVLPLVLIVLVALPFVGVWETAHNSVISYRRLSSSTVTTPSKT